MSSQPSGSTSSTRPSQDLATLRRIKQTISQGEHPDYTAIIKPHALKLVTVSPQEAIEQNERALAIKPRIIHKSRPLQPAPVASSTLDLSAQRASDDHVPASKPDQTDSTPSDDKDIPIDVVPVPVSGGELPTSHQRGRGGEIPSTAAVDNKSSAGAPDTLQDPTMSTSSAAASRPVDPAERAADVAPSTSTALESQPRLGSTFSLPVIAARPASPEPVVMDESPSDEPATPPLPAVSPVIDSAPNVVTTIVAASPGPTPSVLPTPTDLDVQTASSNAPTQLLSPDATDEARPFDPLATSGSALPSAPEANPSSTARRMDVDSGPTADELEACEARRRDEERERDAADRERDRLRQEREQERRASEKAAERARYAEREKEKEAYRAKLREERERETQIEVQKYREEQRERERIANERRQGPVRARGHDQYGRPDPHAQRPALPPQSWDARPAIDARFPPRAQPVPSDPHYIAPSPYRPAPPAVYERAVSTHIQDPRDYPPDPYYDRLAAPSHAPPPPVRGRSPPLPPPAPVYRGYGPSSSTSGRGRSPSPPPPRRAFDQRDLSPPRRDRGAYDVGPPAPRPVYERDDRYDGRGPPPVPVQTIYPTYAPHDRQGPARPRSPPPPPAQAYRRGPSPPPQEDADEIFRRMERLKEEMARLEKEAAVKKLLYRPPPPPAGPPGGAYGGRDGYGAERYRDGPPAPNYGPPPTRPYSLPPPPPQASYTRPPPREQDRQARDSYSYRNRGPPPPAAAPPVVHYEPRFDGPPMTIPTRREEPGPPPPGGGNGGYGSGPGARGQERGYGGGRRDPPPQGGWRR